MVPGQTKIHSLGKTLKMGDSYIAKDWPSGNNGASQDFAALQDKIIAQRLHPMEKVLCRGLENK